MYKDRVLQKEAIRKAVARHRVLHQGITKEGITSTVLQFEDSSQLDIGRLLDKRATLTKLIDYFSSVSKFKPLLKEIRFGVFGPTLDKVGVVLEVLGSTSLIDDWIPEEIK